MVVVNPVINVQPQTLNLMLYSGDGIILKLLCKDSDGDPVSMSGTVTAQIRLSHIAADPPKATFTSILTDAYLGIILLKLTGVQTKALSDDASSVSGKFTGVWDVQWTPAGADPRTLCQGTVECIADVTR